MLRQPEPFLAKPLLNYRDTRLHQFECPSAQVHGLPKFQQVQVHPEDVVVFQYQLGVSQCTPYTPTD
jgi:hypothetical protein